MYLVIPFTSFNEGSVKLIGSFTVEQTEEAAKDVAKVLTTKHNKEYAVFKFVGTSPVVKNVEFS